MRNWLKAFGMSLQKSPSSSESGKSVSPSRGRGGRLSTDSAETVAASLFSKQAISYEEMALATSMRQAGMALTDEQISAMREALRVDGKCLVLDYDRGVTLLPEQLSADKSHGTPLCSILTISHGVRWFARDLNATMDERLFLDRTLLPQA